ncbi:MAG TPA: RES family NAD+ phosphorylase [Solimonas sp.]|nr:RES family NAD+ phosphorylase [Solimonas sp.]
MPHMGPLDAACAAMTLPSELLDAALHFRGDLYRNIVSLRETQDLADDLSDRAGAAALLAKAEMATKPRLPAPGLHRPFEEGYGQAIQFPFVPKHWFRTRFSDGSFGVWYGSPTLETTVHETVHHFHRKLVEDPGFTDHTEPIVAERRVYRVAADALLIDLRPQVETHPALRDPDSWDFCQQLGRSLRDAGHPGLITQSARCEGDNVALLEPRYLSNVRDHCYLRYVCKPGSRSVSVERRPGRRWMSIEVAGGNP